MVSNGGQSLLTRYRKRFTTGYGRAAHLRRRSRNVRMWADAWMRPAPAPTTEERSLVAETRLDTEPKAGQAVPVSDEFRPTRFVRLRITDDPAIVTAALVQVFRTADPTPEDAAVVDHDGPEVTDIRWNEWHREHPQDWTPEAETWMRAWVANRYRPDGGER
jgi:hypothetical protein